MAFKEGHAEKRYFVNFKLPQENRKPPRALSREDFEKIRDVVIPPERITHNIAKDLFLFACYTGVPYADAVSITRDNIYKDDKGDLWLKYLRKKNEYLARVKLLPEAISLIENIVRMTGKSFPDDTPSQYETPHERFTGSGWHKL